MLHSSSKRSPMIISKSHVQGHTLLTVEGVIKLGESARFLTDTLHRVLTEDAGHLLLDLAGINTIDSTGIGELVGFLVRFQENRRKLILISPSERIKKLLEVAQLSPLFPTFDTVDEALAEEPVELGG